ncbi:MAG: sulfatase-like hydrolase/transferase [Planctomycetes bacterium]|nr:sulfatase-like hydrolase/transferase [Planctomycetota bacterium]
MNLHALPRIFALVLVLFLAACSEQPRPNVLFVSIDTLRADRLGAYGYERATSPNIDAFVREGALFENCFAHHGSTWPSLTSILTGKFPLVHGVRENGDMLEAAHRTLPEELAARGYQTAAFLTNMIEAPNRGFEHKFLPSKPFDDLRWDREATTEAVRWLGARDPSRPFFAWLHLMQPHKPYHPPAELAKVFEPELQGAWRVSDQALDEITLGDFAVPEPDLAHIQAQYDAQLVSVDRLVKEVLDALAANGLAENTLVVLFSDHGEELFDHHRYFFHSCSLYDGVLRNVLVMRFPGRIPAGRRIAQQVAETDIAPTVYQLLDLAPPRGLQGLSLEPLFAADDPKRPSIFVGEYGKFADRPIWAVRDGRYKYIHNPHGLKPTNPPYTAKSGGFPYEDYELYDLVADPGETRNVFAEHPDVVERLRRELDAWLAVNEKLKGSAGEMDAATRETMKQLGYIGDDEH